MLNVRDSEARSGVDEVRRKEADLRRLVEELAKRVGFGLFPGKPQRGSDLWEGATWYHIAGGPSEGMRQYVDGSCDSLSRRIDALERRLDQPKEIVIRDQGGEPIGVVENTAVAIRTLVLRSVEAHGRSCLRPDTAKVAFPADGEAERWAEEHDLFIARSSNAPELRFYPRSSAKVAGTR